MHAKNSRRPLLLAVGALVVVGIAWFALRSPHPADAPRDLPGPAASNSGAGQPTPPAASNSMDGTAGTTRVRTVFRPVGTTPATDLALSPRDQTSGQSASAPGPERIKSTTETNVAVAVVAIGGDRSVPLTRYGGRPGSKVKIAGTSTIHDWTVEGALIGGAMDLDARFHPGEDGPELQPGRIAAEVRVRIPVRSLKSGKEMMDNIMYDAMKEDAHRVIAYTLKELTLKATPQAGQPTPFEAVGELQVAGVTQSITLPVTMEKTTDDRLKVRGTVAVKMTDFGIQPPSPKISGGLIKTGDEVQLSIEWLTQEVKLAAPQP